MLLINCKVELSLKWNKNCILSSEDGNSIFTITDTIYYVPIVTLKTEDNTKLSTLLSEGFKRPIYGNKYKVIPNKNYKANEYVRKLVDSSCQGVKRLFVFPYNNAYGITEDSQRRCFLPRIKIENYNIEIDSRNFL